MSVNTIQTAAVIQSELDKAAVEQATSGWMEVNSNLVKYNGGSEVKIPELSMDGLADYDRQNGFVAGGVNFKYQTKTMTQDRGRSFSFDENAVDETNFVLTAATVMGEFQRTKVIPEIDAYRYSTIAAACIKAKKHLADMYRQRIPFYRDFTMTLLRFRKRWETTLHWIIPSAVWWQRSCP